MLDFFRPQKVNKKRAPLPPWAALLRLEKAGTPTARGSFRQLPKTPVPRARRPIDG